MITNGVWKLEAASQDIAAALEIEKKCLYLMSRETASELANLKVSLDLRHTGTCSSKLEQHSACRKRQRDTHVLFSCIRSRLTR